MKVTVKPSSVEKALEQGTWPYRVGVRHYCAPQRNRQEGWKQQSSNIGENTADGQAQAQTQNPRPRYKAQRKTSNIDDLDIIRLMFNIYGALRQE